VLIWNGSKVTAVQVCWGYYLSSPRCRFTCCQCP